MDSLITQLDWPNLVGGAILSSVFGLIVWLAQGLYDYYVAAKDLPYPIWGEWYSAEFDPKGEFAAGERNTFLKAKISRRLRGKASIRSLGPLKNGGEQVLTGWRVKGSLENGDTLVGHWRTTIENTKRYGAVVLKFIDYGRAVGYWTGPAGKDYPLYGDWILSRDKSDIRRLAQSVLDESEFEMFDVASIVMNSGPPVDN